MNIIGTYALSARQDFSILAKLRLLIKFPANQNNNLQQILDQTYCTNLWAMDWTVAAKHY